MRVTPMAAEQAAELLGISTWRLARILRREAQSVAEMEVAGIADYKPINLGEARQLLRAAEAAEAADDMVRKAIDAEVAAA